MNGTPFSAAHQPAKRHRRGIGARAIDTCLKRIAMARFIGWPALEQSWQQTLDELRRRKATSRARGRVA